MLKGNIVLGFMLSLGITLMVVLTRLAIVKDVSFLDYMAVSTFVMLMLTWFSHLFLINNVSYSKLIKNIWIRSIISMMVVCVFVGIMLELLFVVLGLLQIKHYSTEVGELIQKWNVGRISFWSIIFHWILFSQKAIEEKNRALFEASKSQRLALEAKLSSFQEQLSPHFMFNTLNTLTSMTEEPSVHRFVGKLAEVYRYILTIRDQSEVTIKQELDFVKAYWYILKERFEDSIELFVDIDIDVDSKKLPPMTLQTLVENAVKHNKATSKSPLHISIVCTEREIVVSNNIQVKQRAVESTGVGLHNLSERYKLLYDAEIAIVKGDKFSVRLPLR